MTPYRQRLEIAASPEAVYRALTTPQGLQGWWTETCDVASKVGGHCTFRFGPHQKTMQVERLDPEREVHWLCVKAHIEVPGIRPDEWVGTRIGFHLSAHPPSGTLLDFEHIGLAPGMDCYALCVDGWRQYLASLQRYAETGQGAPFTPTDRIERSIFIEAPRDRVWRALADAETFGQWFGADLGGQRFAPGERTRGRITACGYEHAWFDVVVERMEPQALFSYRWHPFAVDPAVDYTAEEPTLVTLTLQDAPAGTLLTVVETGFDKIPPARRMQAFRMHKEGWAAQLQNIRRHAEQTD